MALTLSNKGRPKLQEGFYTYTIKRRLKKTIDWKCSKSNCPGTAKTSLFFENDQLRNFQLKTPHNHEGEGDFIKKQQIINEIKSEVKTTNFTNDQIIYRKLAPLTNDESVYVGKIESLKRMMRETFRQHLNPLPYLNETLRLNRKLLYIGDMEFYRYGPEKYGNYPVYENFIIFFTGQASIKMKENKNWCMDGTFTTIPSPYIQLYTISYVVNDHVFPSFYCFMKSRRQEDYENLFEILKLLNNDELEPQFIKTDYERAAINAMQEEFYSAIISGCTFHLGQAIQRKVNELGLMGEYRAGGRIKKYVKALSALAFINFDEIYITFRELKDDNFPQILLNLYNYFERVYIGSEDNITLPLFPPYLWNVYQILNEDVPRTNNAIEGWHNSFKLKIRKTVNSLPKLIALFQEEEIKRQQKDFRVNRGEKFYKNRKYVYLNSQLMEFIRSSERNSGKDYVLELTNYLYY